MASRSLTPNRCTCFRGDSCVAKRHWRQLHVMSWYVVPWTSNRNLRLKDSGAYSRIWNEVPCQGDYWGLPEEERRHIEEELNDSLISQFPWAAEWRQQLEERRRRILYVHTRLKVTSILDNMGWEFLFKPWRPQAISPSECLSCNTKIGDTPFPNVVVIAQESGTGRIGWLPAAWMVRDLVRVG